ncbi:MAG TPA: TIR domain-containing protein [Solirubrobacteraceae bacterium]|nr:TIR domain-containing protein [Solirubrobacteraceae bacterium]
MAALAVSLPIGHELLGQCIKQGQALIQRASLVGDFSDYESWKAARKQWVDATVQALGHIYGGSGEAGEFADAVSCPERSKRWQEQYSADLKCVEEANGLLTVLQGDLAFSGATPAAAPELTAGTDEREGVAAVDGAGAGESYEQPAREHAAVVGLGDADAQGNEPAPGEPAVPAPTDAPAPQVAAAELPAPPRERDGEREPFAETPADDASLSEPGAVGSELTPAQPLGAQLAHHGSDTAPVERDAAGAPAAAPTRTREVLLAHGRDERWKQAVEHLLRQAGEHEIRIVSQRSGERGRLGEILGEQAPMPRYAVVLLTADDVGAPRLESDAEPFFSTRADQEVVFAMGFLVAALSPGRVCVLYEEGVELPYEVEGVSHVRLDLAGSWQPKLLLHLRRAGFDYDMNKLVPV